MKKLKIEWKHFDKNGKTCQRCSQTGSNLNEVLSDLKEELSSKGVYLEFKETKLPESRMAESNSIFIDGVPLENLVPKTEVGENACGSCSELLGKSANCCCRTIHYKEDTFEEVPVNLIEQAIFKKLKLEGEI